jgi:twitching motility protein PilT
MALHLNDILMDLVQRDGSDLHLKVGQPPFFRIYGRLTRTDYPTLTPELIRELIYAILSEEQIQRLERQRELDMAYELSGVSRFRVNLFHQQGNLAASFGSSPAAFGRLTTWVCHNCSKRLPYSGGAWCW